MQHKQRRAAGGHRWIALAVLVALLCAVRPLAAQDAETQLWTEVGVDYTAASRLHLLLSQHLRFDADISRLGSVMTESGLRYAPADWVRWGAGYRYMYERDNAGDFQSRHRVHADSRIQLQLEKLRAWHRLRCQVQFRRERDDGTPRRQTLRNQVGLQWLDWDLVEPYLAAELFHRLDDPDRGVLLSKLRLTAGVERDFADHGLELFYRVELLQADPEDPLLHIIGVGYQFDW
jgi:hypothetical protein